MQSHAELLLNKPTNFNELRLVQLCCLVRILNLDRPLPIFSQSELRLQPHSRISTCAQDNPTDDKGTICYLK